MKIREKKGFITIYVMLAMIFLIMLITISLINVSRKLNTQTKTNTEIYKMYKGEDIDNMIIDYSTEIPIYTKEEFKYLRNWILDSSKTGIEYMYINGLLYELDANKKSEYIINLKTELYLDDANIKIYKDAETKIYYIDEEKTNKININNFNIVLLNSSIIELEKESVENITE